MTKEIKLNYGALGGTLEEQLNEHGLTLGDKKDFILKLHHAITMCGFHVLTDAQFNQCIKKLSKQVAKYAIHMEVSQ